MVSDWIVRAVIFLWRQKSGKVEKFPGDLRQEKNNMCGRYEAYITVRIVFSWINQV